MILRRIHVRPGVRMTLVVLQVLLIAILAILLLTGCAAAPAPVVQTRYVVQRVTLPPGLLTCDPPPAVPAGAVSQAVVAKYLIGLWLAGQDCRDTVAAIASIEAAAGAQK